MDQQLSIHRQQHAAAQRRSETPLIPDLPVDSRRSKKLIRAVKLLDVLTTGDRALRDYLDEERAACAQAVELAREDMAEAETPEEAEELRPDPIDELVARSAPSKPEDLQALRDALLALCREQISAELSALTLGPDRLISSCSVCGCELHEISPQGDILRHIPISESNADPILRQCGQLLCQDWSIAYIEVQRGVPVPIRG